jgi:type IV pilus assembly protein PilQ
MQKMFFLLLLSVQVFAQEIKSVNFIQEGDLSKLIIEVDKEVYAERFPVTEDKQIILDLKNVKADKKTLRGIDTSEFDGAAVFISGYQKPGSSNDVRFAIQLRDNVRSILESTGNKIVLTLENRFGVFSKSQMENSETKISTSAIKPSAEEDRLRINVPKSASIEDILENLTMAGPKKYIGKKISLNVKGIAVLDVIKMIAETSGFNIILDKGVEAAPPLTLTLTNIPWDQALDTIMALSKLTATKNMNILTIKTLAQATAEAEENAKLEASKIALEPLVTKVFPVSHAEMGSLNTIITDYLTKNRGTIRTDDRTNSMIVRDTVEVIERVKKIIELLDTQTPQVLIEAKIVEASESNIKAIGLSNGIGFGYDPLNSRPSAGSTTTATTTPTATTVTTSTAAIPPAFAFSSAGGPFANVSIASFKRMSNIVFNLQLQESEGFSKTISAPKIITQHRKSATINSTDTTNVRLSPVNLAGGVGTATSTVVPISAPISLTVTPTVTNEGAINLVVSVTKSSLTPTADPTLAPGIASRSINTNVLVENGSTVVLGGLYSTNNSESHSGIPFLKDIPILGWLFRTNYNPASSKSELLVFLTPRIINQEEAGLVDRQSTTVDNESP